jgi:hypothetical protein
MMMTGLIIASYFIFRENSHSNHVQFLSKEELIGILLENQDQYYDTFTKHDLKVRKISDIEEYYSIIRSSACNGTYDLKLKINKCIEIVNSKIRNIENETIHGIYMKALIDIPWKIGFTCDRNYENGFPHTRNDVIILNNTDCVNRSETRLCKLLLHEKAHVYQKMYKSEIEQYMIDNGYKILKTKPNNDTNSLYSANPDIDSVLYVYGHRETKEEFYAKYRENPTSFQDIQYSNDDPKYEHPFEKIAYDIETDVMENRA